MTASPEKVGRAAQSAANPAAQSSAALTFSIPRRRGGPLTAHTAVCDVAIGRTKLMKRPGQRQAMLLRSCAALPFPSQRQVTVR